MSAVIAAFAGHGDVPEAVKWFRPQPNCLNRTFLRRLPVPAFFRGEEKWKTRRGAAVCFLKEASAMQSPTRLRILKARRPSGLEAKRRDAHLRHRCLC